jgi:hypothetical protein
LVFKRPAELHPAGFWTLMVHLFISGGHGRSL